MHFAVPHDVAPISTRILTGKCLAVGPSAPNRSTSRIRAKHGGQTSSAEANSTAPGKPRRRQQKSGCRTSLLGTCSQLGARSYYNVPNTQHSRVHVVKWVMGSGRLVCCKHSTALDHVALGAATQLLHAPAQHRRGGIVYCWLLAYQQPRDMLWQHQNREGAWQGYWVGFRQVCSTGSRAEVF